ncbi:hypothetical protein HZS_2339, partial [Henneguya salminicola]
MEEDYEKKQRQSKITYGNQEYLIKSSGLKSHYYRWSTFRKKCNATLKVDIKTGNFQFKGNHTCKSTVVDKPYVIDTTEEMLSLSMSRAISELHLSAARIWDLLNKEMMSKYSEKSIIKPTREAIVNLISNTPRDQGCGDIYRQVESSVSDCDPRLFLKYNFTYEMKTRNWFPSLHRLLLWSHPDLTPYLRYRRVPAYFDATFRNVPNPFKQCIILMVFNDASAVYIPFVYALVDNKNTWTYWYFLHLFLVLTDIKFKPSTITVEFEAANTKIAGCLRKLKKLKIEDEEIENAMKIGNLDLLT